MKLSLLTIVAILACVLPALPLEAHTQRDSIANAVEAMMKAYPKATLTDVYKSSFQNRFGPGHIISDASKAKEYLDWELQQPVLHENGLYEPTIYDGNYIRVNLSVITDSLVPYEVYFDAFIESAQNIALPSIDDWSQQWHEILEVTEELYPDLPNLQQDKQDIEDRLKQGIYQGHHSNVFSEAYDPHYRIMRRDVFESKIKPLLPVQK